MPNFLVSWTEEDSYRVNIQADSLEEAEAKFYDQAYDPNEVKHFMCELQDSVSVSAVPDEA